MLKIKITSVLLAIQMALSMATAIDVHAETHELEGGSLSYSNSCCSCSCCSCCSCDNVVSESSNVVSDTTIQEYDVPDIDTSFKAYMDYRTITNKESEQYSLQEKAVTDADGFRTIDNKYLVALGTFYADKIGKEFTITLSNNESFDVIVGDIKNDIHTDDTHRYVPMGDKGNLVEFIIDKDVMDKSVLLTGDISNISPKFKGDIRMVKTTKTKKYNNVPVFSPKLANILLNKGYSIVSVALNTRDNKSTVYYFRPDDGLLDNIRSFKHSLTDEGLVDDNKA